MRIRLHNFDQIPTEPGVYLVYSDSPIGVLRHQPGDRPVYVGKADDGLRRRLQKEHHGDTGRSTLRRSLAALLKDELRLHCIPRPTQGDYKPINFTNYSLEPESDSALTDWMERNLWFELRPTRHPKHAEDQLVSEACPALNLAGWQNPFADTLRAARKRCADEARRRAAS